MGHPRINTLTDFKKVMQTPGVTVTGVYHHRENEPRISHFIARFKTPRKVTHATRSYFEIEQGGRLDLTTKAGWKFDGTDHVTILANDNVTPLLTYVVSTPPSAPST